MRRSLAVIASAAIGAAALVASPGAQALDPRAAALGSALGPADNGADDDFYLYYSEDGSETDCGGDTTCDITFTSYAVARSLPNDLLVVVAMAGPTDPEMSNNDTGGIFIDIDTDGDASTFEYSAVTRWAPYPLDDFLSSTLQEWDGDEWQPTDLSVDFIRSEDYWGIAIPWREIGLDSAAFRVWAIGASGEQDRAPATGATPYLPIKEAVDGPEELAAPEITAVTYKKKGKKATATVTWGAVAGAAGYEVRWALNGKRWSAWRTTAGTRVAIKGLIKNKSTKVEVRAVDSAGPGPVTAESIGWGPAFGM